MCTIEFVPQVGDFISSGEPLFNVYGDATVVDERELRACLTIGTERTMEQDPAFAFRIIVDIAPKALSSAINDPTTAVLAVDQLQDLLYQIGIRELDHAEFRDATGRVRLIYNTPNWDNFVRLAVTEFASTARVIRRLRVECEPCSRICFGHYRHCGRRQSKPGFVLLDRAVERTYPDPDDQKMAMACGCKG